MTRILTWIKPTGDGMHLGNYLWMLQPFLDQSKGKEACLMIADYHALTSVHDGEIMREHKKRMIAELFSLIPEDANITIFEQSKIKRINDITWILSSVTPYSLMLRAHSFKDAENKNSEVNMATFNYPILMSSDILLYDVDEVPVWKDQKQHLEFARDIAGFFNKVYSGEHFILPEPLISESVWLIPWTDGRKMSKSYNNFIGVFDDEKKIKKKVMSIETDDTPLEDPKDPEKCSVFALIKFFASEEKQAEIASKYRAGNYGYGHAKLELLEILLEYFWEARKKYSTYMEDDSLIQKRLEQGNNKMNDIADKKYAEIEKLVWLQ